MDLNLLDKNSNSLQLNGNSTTSRHHPPQPKQRQSGISSENSQNTSEKSQARWQGCMESNTGLQKYTDRRYEEQPNPKTNVKTHTYITTDSKTAIQIQSNWRCKRKKTINASTESKTLVRPTSKRHAWTASGTKKPERQCHLTANQANGNF